MKCDVYQVRLTNELENWLASPKSESLTPFNYNHCSKSTKLLQNSRKFAQLIVVIFAQLGSRRVRLIDVLLLNNHTTSTPEAWLHSSCIAHLPVQCHREILILTTH